MLDRRLQRRRLNGVKAGGGSGFGGVMFSLFSAAIMSCRVGESSFRNWPLAALPSPLLTVAKSRRRVEERMVRSLTE